MPRRPGLADHRPGLHPPPGAPLPAAALPERPRAGRRWPHALLRDPDDLQSDMEPFIARRHRAPRGRPGLRRRPGRGRRRAAARDRRRRGAHRVAAARPGQRAAVPQRHRGAAPPGRGPRRRALDGEVSSGGNVPGLLAALLLQSKGDLLQLRPDQWRHPARPPTTRWPTSCARWSPRAGGCARSTRCRRCTGGARALLACRAGVGEEIRLLPEVPTRMLVIGRTHAILPEPLGIRRRAALADPPARDGRGAHPAGSRSCGTAPRRCPSWPARHRRPRPAPLPARSSSPGARRTSRSRAGSASACARCGAGWPS